MTVKGDVNTYVMYISLLSYVFTQKELTTLRYVRDITHEV